MKNILKSIVLLLVIITASCRVGAIYTAKDIGDKLATFEIIEVEKDYLRIEKFTFTITRQNKTESPYQLLIPNIGLYSSSGSINAIPSNHHFKYDNGSSIHVVINNSKTNKGKGFYKLKKQEFLDLIKQNDISILGKEKIKKDKNYGIFFYNEIAILYMNVKEKNLELFNESISSLER